MTDEDTRSGFKKLRPVPRIVRGGREDTSGSVDPSCSFCGKPLGQVKCLVEHGTAKICAACIQNYSALVRTARRDD